MIDKVEYFIKRLRWKAFFSENAVGKWRTIEKVYFHSAAQKEHLTPLKIIHVICNWSKQPVQNFSKDFNIRPKENQIIKKCAGVC